MAGRRPAVPALTTWWLPANADGKPLSKTDYLEQMAAACASEMVRLLNLGQAGQAGFAGEAGSKWLRPADMAVLVNNRSEADAIRGRWRSAACAASICRTRIRFSRAPKRRVAALARRLRRTRRRAPAARRAGHGHARPELAGTRSLNHDELAWEARVLQFRGYRDCWRRQGVLPMLRRLLNDFHLPARLLGQGGAATRAPARRARGGRSTASAS
jgi:exodeoxyribonuclease V beta subunit